jgi:hypothetical protein
MDTVAFFAFGTFWFWALVAVTSIFILGAIEAEKGWSATLFVVGFLVLVHFWGGLKIIDSVKAKPLMMLAYVGGYFVAGTVWGIAKWWFFVRRQHSRYQEAFGLFNKTWPDGVVLETLPYRMREQFKYKIIDDDEGVSDRKDLDRDRWQRELAEKKKNPEFKKEVWQAHVQDGAYCGISFEFKPDPRHHKGQILMWMTYWPWSFVWTMINDPIKKAFKAIYYRIVDSLKSISESSFKDAEADLPAKKETDAK